MGSLLHPHVKSSLPETSVALTHPSQATYSKPTFSSQKVASYGGVHCKQPADLFHIPHTSPNTMTMTCSLLNMPAIANYSCKLRLFVLSLLRKEKNGSWRFFPVCIPHTKGSCSLSQTPLPPFFVIFFAGRTCIERCSRRISGSS